MIGPRRDNFMAAMHEKIKALEGMSMWTVMRRKDLPANAKILPGTWAGRIERAMDGKI